MSLIFLGCKIFFGVLKHDIIYCWFAEKPAFIAVFFAQILKKKSFVVVGGYEAAELPQINYGGLLDKKVKKKINYIIKHADLTLAVSRSSLREIEANFSPKHLMLLYNGVDVEKYYPKGEKENIAITVGSVTKDNLKRKGLETFIRAAAFIPKIEFVLIGDISEVTGNYLRSIASKNVTLTGRIPDSELLSYLQKARVYVQISAHEGFGIALAEAMLCECVPVVTANGALPEVAGVNAFYVPEKEPRKTAKAIKNAMNYKTKKQFREHILRNFSLTKREEILREVIGNSS